MSRRALITIVLAALAACGIPRDGEPALLPGGVVAPVLAPSEPPAVTAGGPATSRPSAVVFLVRAEQLVRVTRRVAQDDLGAVLGRLLTGPREEEFAAGIRTAISTETTLRSVRREGDLAIVDVGAAFVEVGGQEQIMAVAQVVLTATAVPGVTKVRLLLEGQPVDVPRGDGTLTSDSLRAADYGPLLGPNP